MRTLCLVVVITAWAAAARAESLADRAVRILEKRCLSCHGDEPEAGLRLDRRAAVLAGGKSGPALVPGAPDRSLIIAAVRRLDPERAMPPKNALPDDEVTTLTAWVRAGASWPLRPPASAVARLRRLTSDEYLATVTALFGVPAKLSLPRDGVGDSGFVTAQVVSAVEAGRFLTAAEALGAAALKRLPLLLLCDPVTVGEDACARAFIVDFGRRAFRRALEPDERGRLFARYRQQRRAGHDFANAVRMVIEAMLVSPQFLYHDDGNVAARLSYFLTGGPPDHLLAAAADAGQLATREQLAAHAWRLIETRKADPQVVAFHRQWLHLDGVLDLQKDEKRFSEWKPKLVLAAARETELFVRHVFFETDARLETLLSAPFTFVNEPLAKLYGLEKACVEGEDFRRVDLDPAQRAGVLTHASFLATQALPGSTSPVKRGKTIMQDILCLPPPPPPPGLDTTPPAPDPTAQTRALYVQHLVDPSCRGCHARMDPAGFAFEGYDAIGRVRTSEAGRPVDTSGTLVGLASGPHDFTNARELIAVIAHSEEARRCVARKWLRFALGRVETDADAASLDEIHRAFEAAGWDLRALVVAVSVILVQDERRAHGGVPHRR